MPETQANGAPLLVVVHPGSACGSADYSLGKIQGRCAREALAQEISAWQHGILVIDGMLSDEVPDYRELNSAIEGCLARAKAAGLTSQRVMGCDSTAYNQEAAIEDFATQSGWLTGSNRPERITVTGAWYVPPHATQEGQHGACVGSVIEHLATLGIQSEVGDGAVLEADDDEDEEEDDAVDRG